MEPSKNKNLPQTEEDAPVSSYNPTEKNFQQPNDPAGFAADDDLIEGDDLEGAVADDEELFEDDEEEDFDDEDEDDEKDQTY